MVYQLNVFGDATREVTQTFLTQLIKKVLQEQFGHNALVT